MTAGPVVTVIGEALVDLLPDGTSGGHRPRPGGSPFNVAVGLARLGNRAALMARFADDRFGRLLRRVAEEEGVDLRAAARGAERSSTATASIDERGDVTFEFDAEGTVDWQWTAAELEALPPETEALHFGSIASWTPPGDARIRARVSELRVRGGVLIGYDPNVRPTLLEPYGVEPVELGVRLAHVVKASSDDIAWLYPDLPLDEAARRWSRLGPELVVVTAGAEGATAYRRERAPLHRPARPVALVDTLGAGDAFSAGLLDGIVGRGLQRGPLADIPDETLADVLDEAIVVAALTCEREGADPPRRDAVRAALSGGRGDAGRSRSSRAGTR